MKQILTEAEMIAKAQAALVSGEYERFVAKDWRRVSGSRKYKNGQIVRNANPHKSKTNKYCFVGGLRWDSGGGYCVINPYGELVTLDNIRDYNEGLDEKRELAFKNVEADRSSYDTGDWLTGC